LKILSGLTQNKKSGLSTRPDVFFESAVKYEQIDKRITYFKKMSEGEPELLNGSFDYDGLPIPHRTSL